MRIKTRIFKNVIMHLRKRIDSDFTAEISQEERYLMRIINKLLQDQESVTKTKPNTNKIYIRSADESIFVIVDFNNNSASIINHHFGYDVKISNRTSKYISERFYEEDDRRCIGMEEMYRGNIQYSLYTVLNNICNNKNNKENETQVSSK